LTDLRLSPTPRPPATLDLGTKRLSWRPFRTKIAPVTGAATQRSAQRAVIFGLAAIPLTKIPSATHDRATARGQGDKVV